MLRLGCLSCSGSAALGVGGSPRAAVGSVRCAGPRGCGVDPPRGGQPWPAHERPRCEPSRAPRGELRGRLPHRGRLAETSDVLQSGSRPRSHTELGVGGSHRAGPSRGGGGPLRPPGRDVRELLPRVWGCVQRKWSPHLDVCVGVCSHEACDPRVETRVCVSKMLFAACLSICWADKLDAGPTMRRVALGRGGTESPVRSGRDDPGGPRTAPSEHAPCVHHRRLASFVFVVDKHKALFWAVSSRTPMFAT